MANIRELLVATPPVLRAGAAGVAAELFEYRDVTDDGVGTSNNLFPANGDFFPKNYRILVWLFILPVATIVSPGLKYSGDVLTKTYVLAISPPMAKGFEVSTDESTLKFVSQRTKEPMLLALLATHAKSPQSMAPL
jgi:hypothetical protein